MKTMHQQHQHKEELGGKEDNDVQRASGLSSSVTASQVTKPRVIDEMVVKATREWEAARHPEVADEAP